MKKTFQNWKSFLIKEEVYYTKDEVKYGPISVEKVAKDITKHIKRKYPELYRGAELQFKGGKRVLKFTNFGSLKQRDRVIRELMEEGWLSDGQVKRLNLYHRATTNFVDETKSGKRYPIVIELNQGGGPAASGDSYEDELAMILNVWLGSQDLPHKARKEGGSSSKADIIVYDNESFSEPLTTFEAKTSPAADFGQFQILHDPETSKFYQKTQLDSDVISSLFEELAEEISKSCPLPIVDKSSDLVSIDHPRLGEIVEDYYKEKDVDYIIVDDYVYSTGNENSFTPGAPRFKDAAKEGYIRIRRKCHGKRYSTTAGMKFKKIDTSGSKKITDEGALEEIFT